ncbi:MAG: CDP-alcohol phosphatidyltransferase family protein [Methanosarcinaceae archaeon]|nr:CDP-alcohol phosphatidyltransferase family protein [Methanosarcinaceae archaeon]
MIPKLNSGGATREVQLGGIKIFNDLKDSIRDMATPLACGIPLSPNTLTLMGFFVSLATGLAFALGKPFEGGLLILLSGLFDVLDGAVARAKGRITLFGGVLDSVCDRYSDALMFLGLIYGAIDGKLILSPVPAGNGFPGWLLAGFALTGSFLVSYTRARAEAAGCEKLAGGMAERTERMLILVAGALLGFLGWALVAIVVLTHITIVQRLLRAKSLLSKTPEAKSP